MVCFTLRVLVSSRHLLAMGLSDANKQWRVIAGRTGHWCMHAISSGILDDAACRLQKRSASGSQHAPGGSTCWWCDKRHDAACSTHPWNGAQCKAQLDPQQTDAATRCQGYCTPCCLT
jgi:hypothetical protein